MREGMGNDGFVMNDVDDCAGLHLRADYCAEHEWGIKGMRDKFGINDEKVGIEKRRISKSDNVYLVEFTKKKEKCAFLTSSMVYSNVGFEQANVGFEQVEGTWKELKRYINDHRWFDLERNTQSEGVAGAWDEKNFIVVVKGNDNIKRLKQVYEAFQNNDIAIFLGGGQGPFSNAGLSISIISQLPSELTQNMYNVDMNSHRLDKAASKTGIKDRLKKAGLRFFALSPEWNDPEIPSDGVKFYLNPWEQISNNSGWFTVEELDQWITGEGPIPKKKSVKVNPDNSPDEWTDEEGNLIV